MRADQRTRRQCLALRTVLRAKHSDRRAFALCLARFRWRCAGAVLLCLVSAAAIADDVAV